MVNVLEIMPIKPSDIPLMEEIPGIINLFLEMDGMFNFFLLHRGILQLIMAFIKQLTLAIRGLF